MLFVSPWIERKELRLRRRKETSIKTYSRLVMPDLTRQLVDTGILPGDAQDVAITRPAPSDLLICQVGAISDSSAYDFEASYGTGFILNLHIAVDRPAFAILRWELDLPWDSPPIQWLTKPSGDVFPGNMYQLPGRTRLLFPQAEVINHRRVLRRGYGLDGLLLGFGSESIPESYRHGAMIGAILVLVDEMGRGFSKSVHLWADRSAKTDRQRSNKRTRSRLLEQVDYGEPSLIKT